jgi:hypothetical protein
LEKEEENMCNILDIDLNGLKDVNMNLERTKWVDLLHDCHLDIEKIGKMIVEFNLLS